MKSRLIIKIITVVVKIKMAAFPSLAAAVAACKRSFSVCVDRFARRDIGEAHAYCCGVRNYSAELRVRFHPSGVTNQIRQPQKS